MKKNFYLFNPGRLSRKDNTLKFTPVDADGNEGTPRYLPIEAIDNLYCFGSLDANSALYNFIGKNGIKVHFFDYYEHYTGSFYPKDHLLAGKVHVDQVKAYMEPVRRVYLAKKFVEAATWQMLKNIQYYHNRKSVELQSIIVELTNLRNKIDQVETVQEVMGIEGNCRHVYYSGWDHIITGFEMGHRTKRPPSNEVNALISFGNSLCYTLCMDAIYHTQMNPTISFLHEPGARRYSLALDVSEIFKPILVDRLIFRMLNKRELQHKDFETATAGCTLKPAGRQVFVRAWDEKLNETLEHKKLKRKVSFKYLVRLELYKIQKYVMGLEPNYKPFKIYW